MNGKFGEYIEEKRKALGKTLRGFAGELNIAPAFLSDIEKGHRYPPKKEKLYEIASVLKLSKEETNLMFDLAASERENGIAPDLPEYIMGNPSVRVALRMARDNGISDTVWKKVIDILTQEEKK